MPTVNIFDIDTCILPSIFPNGFYKNDKEKAAILFEAYEKAKRSELYPNFIEYYTKNCQDANNYFVTGRQNFCFGFLTLYQLNCLSNKDILFFPDEWNHEIMYYPFKLERIKCIMVQHNKNENTLFRVFDDDTKYYDTIKVFAVLLKTKVEYYKIQSNEGWVELLNGVSGSGIPNSLNNLPKSMEV